ncbi:DUF5935 domain-containing protein [Roseomonas xinghualingensis]|uniref:DUF5935 domain-containing protein n=1 Tax=Roseomonas xinghualingensis TaxID=2986475 RepID=UPI0021F11CF8|nr:DUF5935 domain-containing protein [Roseomonas sp. SXEYE001]MCV4210057.1 DUF5935 domain-containing protein [Roseomonas sp. SXEYE001]
MQGLFILAVWAGLLALGFCAPFVLGLAYIWIDLFRPQDVVPYIMGLFPVSMITACLCGLAYILGDRRNPPPLNLMTVLSLLWAAWITATTTWAVLPEHAWIKWDWAFKTIIFSAFMPFLFRSRIQIEAAILAIILAIFSNTIPFCIKALISGSGYHRQLGLLPINVGLGESSTLAINSIACIPLIIFLMRHSQIMPCKGVLKAAYWSAPAIAIIGAFATFARAGLVSCFIWAAYTWWHSKRKLLLAAGFWIASLIFVPLMGEQWVDRMSTIAEAEKEGSAFTRVVVWQWTIDYAAQHPLGGGFDVYRINRRTVAMEDGSDFTVEARAFHSIYLEVLGEHGVVGAVIFGLLMVTFYLSLFRLARRTKGNKDLLWLHDLARALLVCATTYFAGSAFVGVAFQSFHYFLFALSVAANHYFLRAKLNDQEASVAAWRRDIPKAPHTVLSVPRSYRMPRSYSLEPAEPDQGWRGRVSAKDASNGPAS